MTGIQIELDTRNFIHHNLIGLERQYQTLTRIYTAYLIQLILVVVGYKSNLYIYNCRFTFIIVIIIKEGLILAQYKTLNSLQIGVKNLFHNFS